MINNLFIFWTRQWFAACKIQQSVAVSKCNLIDILTIVCSRSFLMLLVQVLTYCWFTDNMYLDYHLRRLTLKLLFLFPRPRQIARFLQTISLIIFLVWQHMAQNLYWKDSQWWCSVCGETCSCSHINKIVIIVLVSYLDL